MQPRTNYLLGVDFGSDSVRCLVVDAANGSELASAVVAYPRWAERLYCDPAHNRYRQHPLDYVESLEASVRQALAACGRDVADAVCGISFDTTASTPALTDAKGTPLALLPEFAEEPDAMFVLWKDHTALAEADEINDLAKKWEVDYTRYSGGAYSCEWVWAKMLHCLRHSPRIAAGGLFMGGALRLDQRPAGRRHDPRNHRPQPLRGRAQGDVARLVGRTPRAGVSGSGRSAAGPLPRPSLFRYRHGRRVRRPVVRRVGRPAGTETGHRRRRGGYRLPCRGRRGRDRPRDAGQSDGNLDVRHRGRHLRGGRQPDRARHLRSGRWFGAARIYRFRGRAGRLRRFVRLVPAGDGVAAAARLPEAIRSSKSGFSGS